MYCYQCHCWRRQLSAVVRTPKTQEVYEAEVLKAEDKFLKTGKKLEVSKIRIDGYLCKKCATKHVVKDRPQGLGWRDAFKFRHDPTFITKWNERRLEMEIANAG